ncbi:hypothetical protein A5652_06940 [Mycobacterium sp. 1165178.9]|nr:hypothetical protein A5652_06940 [Mycobacterium sp. 1165178.9]
MTRTFTIECPHSRAIAGTQDLTGNVIEARVIQDASDLDLAAVIESEECWPLIRSWLDELLSGGDAYGTGANA